MDLKRIRKALNLSQGAVANRLGIKGPAYSKLERGEIQLTVDRLLILSDLFRMSPEDILYNRLPNETPADQSRRQNVTYVPIAAQAGLLNDFSNEKLSDLGVQFSLPVFYESHLFLILLEGDSMYPTFCNGDYVIVRQLAHVEQIRWGEPYLIIANDGQVVKRIAKTATGDRLLLKSDNNLYEPYEVEKANIRTIWEVKGVISKNLAPRLLRQA